MHGNPEDLRYLTAHYDEKIARINRIGAPLNFLYITDQHHRLTQYIPEMESSDDMEYHRNKPTTYATPAIRSMQYIIDRCPNMRFVVSGGDIGNDYNRDPDAMRQSYHEVMDALYGLSIPVHCVIGNHDDGLGNAHDHGADTRKVVVLPDEMHALCMRNNPTPENYYYLDTDFGYRFIFANTSDRPYLMDEDGQYPFGWRMEISNKQCEWLENDALVTDKRIIFISHAPLHNAGMYGTGAYIKPYDDTLNAPRAYYAVKQCRNVAAMICGHVHFDNLYYDDDIAVISSQCAYAQAWSPSCPERVIGTISETAFDVFSLKDDMMYITRFGVGYDREAHLWRK